MDYEVYLSHQAESLIWQMRYQTDTILHMWCAWWQMLLDEYWEPCYDGLRIQYLTNLFHLIFKRSIL